LGSRNGKRGLGGPLRGAYFTSVITAQKENMATFFATNRAKVIRGERLREQWRNGLGKLGFGDEALCSSAIQEKHHSKHPR
jgi:hypothetical protein